MMEKIRDFLNRIGLLHKEEIYFPAILVKEFHAQLFLFIDILTSYSKSV